MKNYFLLLLLLLLPLLAIVLTGCVKAPIQGRQDPYVPAQVHFANEDLRKHTAVRAPILTRDDAGLLHVEVPIRAATNLRLYVDYRVSFYDQTGQRIYQTGWQTKTLEPNVPDSLTANSVNPRAADFQMDIRYAQ